MTDDSSSIESPEKRLFRQPPAQITQGCAAYMDRVQELRSFISIFFGIIKSFEEVVKEIPKEGNNDNLYSNKFRRMIYNYSAHKQLVNEIILSRTIESFDLYVLSTLKEIFCKKPEILKSEASIDVSSIIDLRNFDEIITFVAERKLHELSFKPLNDLKKFIVSRCGVELFNETNTFQTVLLASEVRNLIAHSDCIVNDVFRRRSKEITLKYDVSTDGKFIISDQWMREVSYTLDRIVFDFDSAVSQKFGLSTIASERFSESRLGKLSSVEAIEASK